MELKRDFLFEWMIGLSVGSHRQNRLLIGITADINMKRLGTIFGGNAPRVMPLAKEIAVHDRDDEGGEAIVVVSHAGDDATQRKPIVHAKRPSESVDCHGMSQSVTQGSGVLLSQQTRQFDGVFERSAIGQSTGWINRKTTVRGSPRSDRIEVLQR